MPLALLSVLLVAAVGVMEAGAQQPAMQQAPPPQAARPAPRPPSDARPSPGQRESMSDSVRRVKHSTGGQILGVERVPFEGRDINRVKYVDDKGRVRYMDDPPRGGAERPQRRRPDNPAEP